MGDVVVIVAVSIVAFVSTNLDNLFLLMGLLAGAPPRKVVVGYTLALAAVLAVGLAGSYVADFSTQAWLRWLGLVPLFIGFWRVRAMFRAPTDSESTVAADRAGGAAPIFGISVANSGDSLAVLMPLMSETSELLVLVICATVIGMAIAWVRVARWVVEHPALAPRLHQIDRYAVPLVLVLLGLYILMDTGTDTV